MVHSIIIPLPLDAHISIKQSIYSENIIINYMTIMIKNYAARLDIVKISVFLVSIHFDWVAMVMIDYDYLRYVRLCYVVVQFVSVSPL